MRGFRIGARTPEKTKSQRNGSGKKLCYKSGVGIDVQDKIKRLQQICYNEKMTEEQILWTIALVDHESAGTWNEEVKGDRNCSMGIAQWNKCIGRIAPSTFEEQAELICKEMMNKFNKFSVEKAIGKHNAPAWNMNPEYVAKVKKSMTNFKCE